MTTTYWAGIEEGCVTHLYRDDASELYVRYKKPRSRKLSAWLNTGKSIDEMQTTWANYEDPLIKLTDLAALLLGVEEHR